MSEFGEELRGFRNDLSKILKEVVEAFFKGTSGSVPNVMQGDTPFIYDIADEKIYCVASKKMVDFAEIDFLHCNKTDTFYYCNTVKIKNQTAKEDLEILAEGWSDRFNTILGEKKLYYFK